ncbi:hypothetical protein AZF08_15600 [Bacillus gaemokensis]|uniref:hypothetical protein n=1 Tax=Bacillus gaemokensis TaxID=574375 RepID=UPI0006896479|nr:hypothetical protein [Bacillus gaemokensis]KYG27176.1 hypothetical protein AZF08_15600 [Bacillus gaemokensis]
MLLRNGKPYINKIDKIEESYLIIADISTKNEALSYQNDWWELVSQNKLLKIPVSNKNIFHVGDKLHAYTKGIIKSLPPIAIAPTIKKVGG